MGEVKNIDINIVGMFSDADEVCELIDVAKVFVVEERMMDISDDTKTGEAIKIKSIGPEKKLKKSFGSVDSHLAFLTVRGLN